MALPAGNISTRFLVLSDTYELTEYYNATKHDKTSPKIDVVLHCGNLTKNGDKEEYQNKIIPMLAAIPAELKLVIAGSLDTALDPEYWTGFVGKERKQEEQKYRDASNIMRTGAYNAWYARVHVLKEGTHTFRLKTGAKFTVYASPYSPMHIPNTDKFAPGKAFKYVRSDDRFNPVGSTLPSSKSIATNPIPDFPGVDIVMTHSPAAGLQDLTPYGHQGCENLRHALERSRPRLHISGHIATGSGITTVFWRKPNNLSKTLQRGEGYHIPSPYKALPSTWFGRNTVAVNASVKDVEGEIRRTALVVDLELPCFRKPPPNPWRMSDEEVDRAAARSNCSREEWIEGANVPYFKNGVYDRNAAKTWKFERKVEKKKRKVEEQGVTTIEHAPYHAMPDPPGVTLALKEDHTAEEFEEFEAQWRRVVAENSQDIYDAPPEDTAKGGDLKAKRVERQETTVELKEVKVQKEEEKEEENGKDQEDSDWEMVE